MAGIHQMLMAGADALTATASPSFVGGDCTDPVACTAFTDPVTATPSGGTAPYTYSWEHVSGDVFGVTAPTSQSTAFSATATTPAFRSGTYRCRVTDAASQEAFTNGVTVSTTHTDGV